MAAIRVAIFVCIEVTPSPTPTNTPTPPPPSGDATWHHTYDGLGRLIISCSDWSGTACNGPVFTYNYDGAGNLTRFDKWNTTTQSVEIVRYIYNGANQIQCVDANNDGNCTGEFLWVYDAYGNLTNDGASTYVYDAENRLASVTATGSTTSYAYNGDGDRVSQTVNGTLTTYVLDVATPLTMVLSETSNGSTLHYWQGLDVLAQSDGTNTKYFEYDGLGSVRQLTDASGIVGLAQTFDPYGNGYSKAGTATTSLGFDGEQTDSNGFVFLRARYYYPSSGRFLNTDPSRHEQNPYLFAMGNPVMHTDPSGLCGDGPLDFCIDYSGWPEGPPPGIPYLTTPAQLMALGFNPTNTDPLPLEFYMNPTAFDFQVSIEHYSDFVSDRAWAVPLLSGQLHIPNIPGQDECYPASFALLDRDHDGIVEFNRFVYAFGQWDIAMQAEWTVLLHNGEMNARESFTLGLMDDPNSIFYGQTLAVADTYLRPIVANRDITFRSVETILRPQGLQSPTLTIPIPDAVEFKTHQTSATTLETVGQIYDPFIPGKLVTTITYEGTKRPPGSPPNVVHSPPLLLPPPQ